MPEELKHSAILAKDLHIADERLAMEVEIICCQDYGRDTGSLVLVVL